MRELALFEDLRSDLRFAARAVGRHPLVSAIAVITLATGIGVSSGIFTLFDAAAFRPHVLSDPASFAQIFPATDPARPGHPGDASLDEYKAFARARTLSAVAAHHRYTLPMPAMGNQNVPALLVTCTFFAVVESEPPLAGRLLETRDCDAAAPVAVIDERLWRSSFKADRAVVGAPLDINGVIVTVIGVAPASAAAFDDAHVWMPASLRRYLRLGDPSGADRWLSVEGRLAPRATRRQAAAELAVLVSDANSDRRTGKSSIFVTDGSIVSDPRKPLVIPLITLVMSALSALVLIACANVAVLLLSQADARQQEIAVRLSLGARRGRLVRMLLTETFLLAACAGAAAIWLAYEVPILMFKWFGAGQPAYPLSPDWRVFAFLTATTGLAGAGAGLAPALESMRVDVLDALRGRRSLVGEGGGSAVRNGLVGVQIALSFVLLVGGGLFAMTHYRLVTGSPGFEASHVLVVRSDVTPAAIGPILSAMPGTRTVAFGSTAPVLAPRSIEVSLEGVSPQRADTNEVSPGWFNAIGLPIVRGRGIEAGDGPCGSTKCHVVVSEEFARRFTPGKDPLGRLLRSESGEMEIVGVVRDLSAQHMGIPDPPIVYQPWTPSKAAYQAIARFDGDPAEFSRTAAATLRRTLPTATAADARTARWYIDAFLDELGPIEMLILALGIAAATLAVIGVFGVMSFNVTRRTRELGLRVALGARPRDIYTTVLGGGLAPAGAGLAAGVALAIGAAAAFNGVLSQMHFAVSTKDPLTYFIVALLLGAVVFLALLVPARRATRLDPYAALRSD